MPGGERQQVEFVLECVECGEIDDRGIGWRAYLDADDDVWIYCAACAEREFSDK
ncbi:MAG TPA: hypothetical protein VNP93_01810 [Gaiellaceae bacterium]|nr:hypothetical protein [Gaiellaceae bacterium]